MRPKYLELSDHLNNAHYLVYLPVDYAPISAYYEEFNTEPIYQSQQDIMPKLSRGVATISQMIDIYQSGECVEIPNDDDILEIAEILDAYLNRYIKIAESNKKVDFTPEQHLYIKSATSFYRAMQPTIRRVHAKRGTLPKDATSLDGLMNLIKRGES